MKEVIISILTYNKLEYTKKCLQSIFETPMEPQYKIVVSDNGSTDGTIEFLKKKEIIQKIQVIENKENLGFAKAHNNVMKLYKEHDIVLMNNDLEVPFYWLFIINNSIIRENLGAASPAIQVKNGLDIGAVLNEKAIGRSIIGDENKVPDWITGSCIYISRETLNKIGYLDENFKFYYEDVDFCRRMKEAGIKFRCIKDVVIKHHDSTSSTPEQKRIFMEESRKYFTRKWGYKS